MQNFDVVWKVMLGSLLIFGWNAFGVETLHKWMRIIELQNFPIEISTTLTFILFALIVFCWNIPIIAFGLGVSRAQTKQAVEKEVEKTKREITENKRC